MADRLTWAIYDRDNNLKARLHDRKQGAVTVALNGGRSAQVTIPLDSDAAAHALAVKRELHVELNNVPIFHGPIMQPRASSSGPNDGNITLQALGPEAQLARQFRFIFNEETAGPDASTYGGIDDNYIMQLILRDMDERYESGGLPGHRIDYGNVDSAFSPHLGGPSRTVRFKDGSNAWDTLTALAAMSGASDFDFEPLLASDYSAILRTYPAGMGSDKTDSIRFDWGWGKNNALGFAHAPAGDQLVTRAFVIGPDPEAASRTPKVADVEHTADLAEYGAWASVISRQNLTTHTALGAVGKGAVGAGHEPVSLLEFTAAPPQGQIAAFNAKLDGPVQVGAGYLFGPDDAGGDFWIGDTIAFVAKANRYLLDHEGRVTAGTIAEDDAGLITAGITAAPIPDTDGMTQTDWTL